MNPTPVRYRVADELAQLMRDLGCALRAQDVLDYARRNPQSALYGEFIWYDDEFAEKYLLLRAGEVLRAQELREISMYHATVVAEDGVIHHTRSPSQGAVLAWSRAFLRPQLVAVVHW